MTENVLDLSVVHDAALYAAWKGLSVIPIRPDGTKSPAIAQWGPFQTQRAPAEQLEEWFADPRLGLGIVCGEASGNLEMFEFEGRAVDEGVATRFGELVGAAGLKETWDRIRNGYCERTPGDGFHIVFRVDAQALGNTKLARRPATVDELAEKPDERLKVLIETRGRGGYFVAAPSNGSVHATGRPWALVTGDLGTVATISVEERDALYDIARSLDQVPAELARPAKPGHDGEERPGDRYNAAPDAQERELELLLDRGWTKVYEKGGVVYLRRPGKDRGVSATLGHIAPGILRVFTTSTEFDDRSYDPFGVYTVLEHGGDWGAAARSLAGPAPVATDGSVEELYGARSLVYISREPPSPLLVGRLDPEGHTIIFGPGGSFKGVYAAHLIVELAQAGHEVLIVDYENHPTEWARRIFGLGGEATMYSVVYVSPAAPEWHGPPGAIWKHAAELRRIADVCRSTVIVIDSVSVACGDIDPSKPEAATQYSTAIASLGRPVTSLAHVADSDRDLRKPFGSVQWHNQARMTWALRRDGEGALLSHRKANNYRPMGSFTIEVTWFGDLPRELAETRFLMTLAEEIVELLGDDVMTVEDIAKNLRAGGRKVADTTVRRTLTRGVQDRRSQAKQFDVVDSIEPVKYRVARSEGD